MYSILVYTDLCSDNIPGSLAKVTQVCMNGVWRKLWPECVNDVEGFKDVFPAMKKVILGLANEVGFSRGRRSPRHTTTVIIR